MQGSPKNCVVSSETIKCLQNTIAPVLYRQLRPVCCLQAPPSTTFLTYVVFRQEWAKSYYPQSQYASIVSVPLMTGFFLHLNCSGSSAFDPYPTTLVLCLKSPLFARSFLIPILATSASIPPVFSHGHARPYYYSTHILWLSRLKWKMMYSNHVMPMGPPRNKTETVKKILLFVTQKSL